MKVDKIDSSAVMATFVYLGLVSCQLVLILSVISNNYPKMSNLGLLSVDFEVYGIVQGVFFRKHTQKEASKLGLRGWCMNTSQGTVKGVLEGDANKVNDMKNWLKTTGSPSSRIDKAEFKNEKQISQFTYDSFSIKR